MTDFGSILKQLLDDRGISQRWLADAASTKEATISRYINGVNKNARLDILVDISKALGVSTDYLLGLSEVQRTDMTREEQVLLSCFRRASEDDLDTLWCLLRKYMTPSEKAATSQPVQAEAKIG